MSLHSRDTVMSVSVDVQQHQQRGGYALDFCFEPHTSVCARDCCNHSQDMQAWHVAKLTLHTILGVCHKPWDTPKMWYEMLFWQHAVTALSSQCMQQSWAHTYIQHACRL